MPLSENLKRRMDKTYEPEARIDSTFKRKDVTFFTNKEGDPVLLFIGERKDDGSIKGERYTRVLQKDEQTGKVLKNHWDRKGKVY